MTAVGATAITGGGLFLIGNRHIQSQTVRYVPRRWTTVPESSRPVLAAAHGSDYRKAVRYAIGALGGLETFIKSGESVVVKPNIGWDRTAEQGANTHPEIVAELVRLSYAAGAQAVTIIDVPCNDAERTFNRSGIKAEAEKAGALVVIPKSSDFTTVDFGEESLGEWDVLTAVLECDKLINVPVVKHHSLCGMTAGMKNWLGVLTGPRNRLHQGIGDNLVELAKLFSPTLTVIDATRVLQRNGPTGGRLEDVATFDTIVAATDQVAAEAYVTKFLDSTPSRFPFIAEAERAGLGRMNPPNDRIVELSV